MILKNKLKNIDPIIIVFVLILTFYSCKTKNIQSTTTDTAKYENHVKATVFKSNLDGCTWLIKLEGEERNLEPIGLTDEFKVDNLKIWIQYKPNKEGMGICMAGEVVTIIAIAKR